MPDEFTERALAKVDAFIEKYAGYTQDGVEQPHQGATNRVVFARRGNDLVVFKVFCTTERRDREVYALRHWRDTGLVPGLLWDDDPTMIVTTHIPGIGLFAVRDAYDDATWREACGNLGRVIGSLMRVPLSDETRAAFESRFYEGLGSLEAYLGRIVELGRSIHRLDRDFQGGFWAESLNFIEVQLPRILSQPRVLYHQDPGNHHFDGSRFRGFFDLEMCRVGGAAMQLAYCVEMLRGSQEGWHHFCESLETTTGAKLSEDDRLAIAAAAHLLSWRVICRYMSYDGNPGTGYAWAEPAEPEYYQQFIQEIEAVLGIRR